MRHLEFRVTNAEDITEGEKKVMSDISDAFNQGGFADFWECRRFRLEPLSFHPSYQNLKSEAGCDSDYDEDEHGDEFEYLVRKHLAQLQLSGIHRIHAIRQLHKEGKVHYLHPGVMRDTLEVGNDVNVALIYVALLMVSLETQARITLKDDGGYLLVPLVLENGQASAWDDEMRKEWRKREAKEFALRETSEAGDVKRQRDELLMKFPPFTPSDPEAFCRKLSKEDRLRVSTLVQEAERYMAALRRKRLLF